MPGSWRCCRRPPSSCCSLAACTRPARAPRSSMASCPRGGRSPSPRCSSAPPSPPRSPAPRPSIDRAGRQLPVRGGPADLERVAQEVGAEHVIIAFTNASDSQLIPLVRSCEKLGLEISLVPRLFESVNDRIALEHLGGLPLLVLRAVDPKGWQFTFKHALDRLGAGLMLVVLAPVLLVTAFAVKASPPGPVLYRQRRVGRDGQVFDMLKFRSMREPQGKLDFQPDPGRAPG